MLKFIKKLFSKTFFIIFIIILVFCLFFYWGWFEKQYYKGLGVYKVYKGDRAYHHGELQKAIDYYNEGLELYPEHYGAWYNLGNIYVAYEDYYSAIDAYEKAIENNKNFTLAKMNLGIISTEKLGDFDEAIKQYNSIINTKRNLFTIPFIFSNKRSEKINKGLAYYNMGVAYREKSLYKSEDKKLSYEYLKKAIESYQKAAKILKKDYNVQYNLALAYHLAKDYQKAGTCYCKAIEISPMEYEAHYNLAILLRHLRMYKAAYSEMEKAGILVSNQGNANTQSYVFDVLNDLSRILITNNQYNYLIEKMDNEPKSGDITYFNGRMILTDDLDRAMLNNFKTCEQKDFFQTKGK